MTYRQITEIRSTHPSRDGDGVAIQRVHGMQHAGMDPILMIDELRSEQREDFAGGFPPHPHRGMQTLTYMKRGGIIHQDSLGNRGEIRGGGAQWMSAGRGVIHSEMPTVETTGLHGFQIWINLPAVQKLSEPRYRDIPAQDLATANGPGVSAAAIAGEWHLHGMAPLQGPLVELAEQAAVFDLELASGASIELHCEVDDNLMVYVYEGDLEAQGRRGEIRKLLLSGAGERLALTAGADGASALVLRGAPIREPVAHYGPFVMNTSEEIEQAIRDYQSGRFTG